MNAGDETLLTQAALDGELDAAGMLDFENRLAANAFPCRRIRAA